MPATLRTCPNGHRYHKSSDCPVCPKCEAMKQAKAGPQSVVAAPARRALERAGISTWEQLAAGSETELLALHGMGKSAIRTLKAQLEKQHPDMTLKP